MRRCCRFLSRFARRDITPGADNLHGRTPITDKVLLVIHPTIGSILPAEAVLHRVDPVVEELGDRIFHTVQIVGVNPVAPE